MLELMKALTPFISISFLFLGLMWTIILGYVVVRARRSMIKSNERIGYLLHDSTQQLYRQLEGLLALYKELNFDRGLPPLRGWAPSPDVLVALAERLRRADIENYLECGSGVSTIVAARIMQIKNKGHVFSLEHDPIFAAETRHCLRRFGLYDWATVIDAPLNTHLISNNTYLWYDVSKIPDINFDAIFVDGPPGHLSSKIRYPAGPVLLPMLTLTGFMMVDDANRADEHLAVMQWLNENSNLQSSRIEAEKGCVILSFKSCTREDCGGEVN